MNLNLMFQGIKHGIIFFGIFLLVGCSNEITEVEDPKQKPESEQEKFIRKLYAKKLICNDSIDILVGVIRDLSSKSGFGKRYQVNQSFDSTYLNFYIVDSRRDSSLIELCAFAGNNTIFLDKVFLTSYFRNLRFFKDADPELLKKYYIKFQYWVIGHEIAHADLGHLKGHFINSAYPEDQKEAKLFHKIELEADQKSISYFMEIDTLKLNEMLINLFNSEYDKKYKIEDNPGHVLKVWNDPSVIYSYELSGSHSTMVLRSGILLYLTSCNAKVKAEAYQFLVQSQLHMIRDMVEIPENKR